jgi:hypothetical protein
VLAQLIDPSMTNRQISDLKDSMGRADGLPPFPDGTNTTTESNGSAYNLSTGSAQEGTPATAISVY